MSKSTRQSELREKLLKAYPDFPVDKLSQVLIFAAEFRHMVRIGPVRNIIYNRSNSYLSLNFKSTVEKGMCIEADVSLNIISDVILADTDITLNSEPYISFDSITCRDTIKRTAGIVEELTAKQIYTDSEVLEIIEKISVANSLAKTECENSSFLYGVKHGFLNYVAITHKNIVEYLKPMLPKEGERRLLEIKIGSHIFHVPYEKHKIKYGFIWTSETKPELYIKRNDPLILPDNLDYDALCHELARIYIKISGGKPGNMRSGAVKYWWCREVLRKKYNNPNLELVVENEELSNYSAQDGTKYKMINGDVMTRNSFFEYFMEAVKSGIKL